MFNTTVDTSGIEQLVGQIERPEQMPAAISRALNRAGDQATTAIGRELVHETGAHVGDRWDAMEQNRSTPSDLECVITISGGLQPLSEFSPPETSKGISAGPGLTAGCFRARSKSRSEGVFTRVCPFLPIRQLWGPSLGREAQRGATFAVAKDAAAVAVPRRPAHEVRRLLSKSGGGNGGE